MEKYSFTWFKRNTGGINNNRKTNPTHFEWLKCVLRLSFRINALKYANIPLSND